MLPLIKQQSWAVQQATQALLWHTGKCLHACSAETIYALLAIVIPRIPSIQMVMEIVYISL